jgi:uncharacterized protein YceK
MRLYTSLWILSYALVVLFVLSGCSAVYHANDAELVPYELSEAARLDKEFNNASGK